LGVHGLRTAWSTIEEGGGAEEWGEKEVCHINSWSSFSWC